MDNLNSERLNFAATVLEKAAVTEENRQDLLLELFATTPREIFFAPEYAEGSEQDVALPVEAGIISPRPSILARMIDLSGATKNSRILLLGCESGYLAALLATAGAFVFSVESVGQLAQLTRKRLDGLSYGNIMIRGGNWERGWKDYAPFDAVISLYPLECMQLDIKKQIETSGGRFISVMETDGNQRLCMWEADSENGKFYELEECNIF